MDSEIIVYMSKLRKYFKTNKEAREYFTRKSYGGCNEKLQ